MASPTYTSVLQVGALGTINNLLAAADTVYRCSTCGALTDKQATHTQWHADQETAIQNGVDALTAVNLNTTCPLCSSRLPKALLASHLTFHARRARDDPGDMPTQSQMDAATAMQG